MELLPDTPAGLTSRPARPGVSPPSHRGGSSNSRPRFNRDRSTPPTGAQLWAIRAAVEEGRCSAVEAEQLTGFLWLGPMGQSERTVRRRVARLVELGIPGRTEMDNLVDELKQLLARGEISYEEAEIRAGRFMLAQLEVQQLPSSQ